MEEQFKAVVIDKQGDECQIEAKEVKQDVLPDNDVLIKVHYSGINYKDGLAGDPNGKIVTRYPFIPGIDLAGEVEQSNDDRYKKGDKVIATSYEIGVSQFGGLSEYASVPAEWVVPLPDGLTLKESMILGTAGFTAALSIQRLEENGLNADSNVLVTGASGGVGSLSVGMLSNKGYTVTASTGKSSEHEFLKQLGAEQVISREEVYNGEIKSLAKQKWDSAVDPVGGKPLAALLSQMNYLGSVAVCGLTAGVEVPTTVHPFILRGINLLGIDSVYCPMETRQKIWQRLADDLKLDYLEDIVAQEITLDEVPSALKKILKGEIRGRIIVKM